MCFCCLYPICWLPNTLELVFPGPPHLSAKSFPTCAWESLQGMSSSLVSLSGQLSWVIFNYSFPLLETTVFSGSWVCENGCWPWILLTPILVYPLKPPTWYHLLLLQPTGFLLGERGLWARGLWIPLGFLRSRHTFFLNYLQGFSRQEYWSGLPCPHPGGLPHPGLNLRLLGFLHCKVGLCPSRIHLLSPNP